MAKITIIGAGAFGTSIGKVLALNQSEEIRIWSYEEDVADMINSDHENKKYLPGIELPENLVAYSDMDESLKDSEIIFFISPSAFTKDIAMQARPFVHNPEDKLIVCMAKGFVEEDGRPKLLLDAIEDIFPEQKNRTVYVSGPTHAEELGKKIYSGLVSASFDKQNALKIKSLLENDFLSVYTSEDPIGSQVSAALKNVIAIVYGILDGLKESSDRIGDNTESYIYSRGLMEIFKIAELFGEVDKRTFLDLNGAGDLLVTCSSIHGRNRRFGYEIVKKKILEKYPSLDEAIKGVGYLPEGAYAIKHIMNLEEKEGIKVPLMELLWDILNRKTTPEEGIIKYMESNDE